MINIHKNNKSSCYIFIFQGLKELSKFYSEKLKYSQTCSNDHLYKMTSCQSWPVLSPPEPICISLLHKITTCLTWPATTFLPPKWKKKPCIKQPLQNFIQGRNGKQCIKKEMSLYTFILLRLVKWVPGTPGDWVVKSKLSPCSGTVGLRQLNPIQKKSTEAYLEHLWSFFVKIVSH